MTATEWFEGRKRAHEQTFANVDGRSALVGHGRVLLAAALVWGAIWVGWSGLSAHAAAFAAGFALVVASFPLQTRFDRRAAAAHARAEWCRHELARLRGEWRGFASRGDEHDSAGHLYASDLDLFGAGSLFQQVDTTRTRQGSRRLASWLSAPADRPSLEARQSAARSLAGSPLALESFATAGVTGEATRIDEGPILAWAQIRQPPLPTALRLLSYLLPAVALVALWGAHVRIWNGLVPAAAVVVNLLFLRRRREVIREVAGLAERAERELVALLPLFAAAAAIDGDAPALVQIRGRLGPALAAINDLRRRVTLFQSRANVFVAFLGPVVLWDHHAASRLEGWRALHGTEVAGWFDALAELEALHTVALHAFGHPADAWAEVVDETFTFEAEGLGHPLIDESRCVRNDLRLGGAGRALLVTGSNMSGKSTFLRSCGLAVVMALAGFPVRARRLKLSPMRIATSMRVSDSLQEGASFFLAEVKRLRRVVEAAQGAPPLFFLLDEILQGTNTRERSLGARGVVALLVGAGASGLVSTHDLSLVQLEGVLGDRLTFAHFTDQVEGDRMTFDHRIRPGVVQSTNALRVMQANGLEVAVPDDEVPSAVN